MGYYLEVDSQGKALGHNQKAQKLIADGATEVDGKTYQKYLVCVVDNGPFEAAGFANTRREHVVFAAPDAGPVQRPRRWLIAEQACKRNFRPETIARHEEDYIENMGERIAVVPLSREQIEAEAKAILGPDAKVIHMEDLR